MCFFKKNLILLIAKMHQVVKSDNKDNCNVIHYSYFKFLLNFTKSSEKITVSTKI